MTALSRSKRRVIRTIIGALGGLLGGLGATLVVAQSGRYGVDFAAALSPVSIAVGATIGFIEPPGWVRRAIGVAIVVSSVGVVATATAAPATAQSACSVLITVDGVARDLGVTSSDDPIVIDIGNEPVIAFEASAPGVDRGLIEVTASDARPSIGGWPRPADSVVYFGEVAGGAAAGTVTVERAGPTGFRLNGDGYVTEFVPLGLVELRVSMIDLDDDNTVDGCPESVWVRVVTQPSGNWLGRAGVLSSIVGFLGVAVAGPLRQPFRLGPPPPAPAPPPPPPPVAVFPTIPGLAPFVEHTGARVLEADGRPVDPSTPLVSTREYQIEITFGLGLQARDEENPDRPELQVGATSRTLPVQPTIEIGAPGLPVTVPLTRLWAGRHQVHVHATRHGHHVQTEVVSLAVVDDATVAVAQPQTRSTLISTVIPTDDALERLPQRQVLVSLIADTDHTVDARVTDVEGNVIVHYDSPLPAAALDTAAADLRTRLGEMLARGGGSQLSYTSDELAQGFGPVVSAGQRMSIALFPDTSVTTGDVGALSRLVVDGATVQVVSHRAGLGNATLPWGLVYDRPFVVRSAGNRVCSSFATHGVDKCPNLHDAEVWCPTGFWGYRAIVEELWSTTERSVLAPPIAPGPNRGPADTGPSIVAYLQSDLEATSTKAGTFERRGAMRLTDFDHVRRWMSADDPSLELLYFYAHHDAGPSGGLRIVDDVLMPATLNVFRNRASNRWPGRPLVIVNACGSGASASTDPVSFVAELRSFGAGGIVTSECTLWDPLAGECGLRIVQALADGGTIGVVLRDLRRGLLAANNNPMGLAYRLHASADASVGGARPS